MHEYICMLASMYILRYVHAYIYFIFAYINVYVCMDISIHNCADIDVILHIYFCNMFLCTFIPTCANEWMHVCNMCMYVQTYMSANIPTNVDKYIHSCIHRQTANIYT